MGAPHSPPFAFVLLSLVISQLSASTAFVNLGFDAHPKSRTPTTLKLPSSYTAGH